MEKFLETITDQLLNFIPNLIGALVTLGIGLLVKKFLFGFLAKHPPKKLNHTLYGFLLSCGKVLWWAMLFVCVAGALGIDTTSFVAALGGIGVTIGLALKDSLSNLAGGLMLIIGDSVHEGDYIEVDGLSGTVRSIEMLFVALDTPDNKRITIPNNVMNSAKVVNYSRNDLRRVDLTFSVAYGDDLALVKRVLTQTVEHAPYAEKTPEPLVAVLSHGDNAVQLAVKIWCSRAHYWDLYFYMQERVKLAFDENGIHIPFPQMDVHMVKNED